MSTRSSSTGLAPLTLLRSCWRSGQLLWRPSLACPCDPRRSRYGSSPFGWSLKITGITSLVSLIRQHSAHSREGGGKRVMPGLLILEDDTCELTVKKALALIYDWRQSAVCAACWPCLHMLQAHSIARYAWSCTFLGHGTPAGTNSRGNGLAASYTRLTPEGTLDSTGGNADVCCSPAA